MQQKEIELIDHFAGQVIGEIIRSKEHSNFSTQDNVTEDYARLAYKVAQAMMKVRENYIQDDRHEDIIG